MSLPLPRHIRPIFLLKSTTALLTLSSGKVRPRQHVRDMERQPCIKLSVYLSPNSHESPQSLRFSLYLANAEKRS